MFRLRHTTRNGRGAAVRLRLVLVSLAGVLLSSEGGFTIQASAPAHAQAVSITEATAELAAGGLVYASLQSLVTEREDIVVGAGRISATYVVRNTGEDERTTLVAFPLPDIDMLALDGASIDNPAYDPLNPTNFVGLSAQVDGQAADTFVESHALALGLVDVTSILRDLKLPLYPFHPDLPALLAELPEPAKSELVARNLVRMADGRWEPLWQLKTTLFWLQTFAPGQVRTLSIGYRPIAGVGPWIGEAAAALRQRYCVPAAAAAELDARAASNQPATVRWVHYLAYAGAGARGPAGAYRVAIETAPQNGAYSCLAGLSAETPGRERLLTDHIPEEEVQVLFVD